MTFTDELNLNVFFIPQTLRQIKEFNFSVGIFAPGWTFENMPNADPFAKEGSDDCNNQFLTRNNRFWGMLWKYLYSRGPNTLPFYTSFCVGSGKRQYRDGLAITNEPWFNLMEQEYQTSVPSLFKFHFNEAYRGGSCIEFNETVQNARLFVTDFPCQEDIVLSYVYKRTDPKINITMIVNVENEKGDKNILVHCNSDGSVVDEQINHKTPCQQSLNPLGRYALRTLLRGLALRDEKTFPSTAAPVNGWETRYFYLNFHNSAQFSRIVDIGITVHHDQWQEKDALLLGALHIHNGVENNERLQEPDKDINFTEWTHHTHSPSVEVDQKIE